MVPRQGFPFQPFFLGACVNFMVIIRIYVRLTLRVFPRKFAKMALFSFRVCCVCIYRVATVYTWVYIVDLTNGNNNDNDEDGYNKPF